MADLYKYGVAVHIYKPIIKRAVVDFAVGADWTPAAGDVKISKDGGAAANVTNLPTAISMGNTAMWDFSITATEMQAAQIRISVSDSATKAVEDTFFEIDTYGNASAQHAIDLDDAVRAGLTALPNANAEAAGGLYTRGSGAGQINQNANGQVDTRWVAGNVTVGTNNDKTSYTLSAAGIQAIWDALTSALTTVGSIGKLLVDNINATISSRSTLDAAGIRSAVGLASANLDTQLTAIDDYIDTEVAAIKAKTDNLPASPAATSDIPSAAAIADQVWDEAIAGHLGAGSTGEKLNSAGSAGDPWSTAVPGAYGAGTAGKILGDNLNATVSSRSSHSAADVWTSGTRTLTDISATIANKLADHVLRRSYASARASADGDAVSFRSPLGAIAKLVNKWAISGATLTVYHEDDLTSAGTQAITSDAAAEPITSLDT